jgi:hypothetical protein
MNVFPLGEVLFTWRGIIHLAKFIGTSLSGLHWGIARSWRYSLLFEGRAARPGTRECARLELAQRLPLKACPSSAECTGATRGQLRRWKSCAERRVKTFGKLLEVEWLSEEADRSGVQRACLNGLIGVSSDKNNRNINAVLR